MKNIYYILFFALSYSVFAQTDGLSYQSVIIDPVVQEIPGVDVSGNVLNNENIEVRFTIIASGNAEYREVQTTKTDAFGMFSVIIGRGTPDFGDFNNILWDGTPKDLKVEIKLTGSDFKFQEEKELLFIPYAFHRDVLVTKTLDVDGNAIFKDNLIVDGRTLLNNDLFVNNESETLTTGSLSVHGITILNDSLTVANASYTYLSGSLDVNNQTLFKDSLQVNKNTLLRSNLRVDKENNIGNGLNVEAQSPTVFTGSLFVNGETNAYSTVNVNNESNVNVSGDLLVEGSTVFNQDLTVNGLTNLNNNLNVNNASPSTLSGTLTTQGAARVENTLVVTGASNIEGNLNVNGQNPTQLSGSLRVDELAQLNNSLSVNNQTATNLSGDLTVGGDAVFNENVTINGTTNLNDALFVNNGAPTILSGTLTTEGATRLANTLNVEHETILNSDLTITNESPVNLSGMLDVTESTTINNTFEVLNGSAANLTGTLLVENAALLNNKLAVTSQSPSILTGDLLVGNGATLGGNLSVLNGSSTNLSGILETFGIASFNSTFRVNNNAPTSFSGTLNVDGTSTFQNSLTVANNSASNLSGTLVVGGAAQLNNGLNVTGISLINNNLTVTQTSNLATVSSTSLNLSDDQSSAIAVFQNNNAGTTVADSGNGFLIKLGRTHGAYNGPSGSNNPNDYLKINNPITNNLQGTLDNMKTLLENGGTMSPTQALNLVPLNLITGAIGAIGNGIINRFNNTLSLPLSTPAVVVPATTILPEITIFSGTNQLCSGRYCFNPCTFFNCTICIPPIEFCVPALPRIYIPEVRLPQTTVLPAINNIVPAIPAVFPSNTDILTIPNFTFSTVSNSMSKENVFMAFQDKDGRQTGSIAAQSTADFRDNTILDDVYVLNVLSNFVGVDQVEGIIAGFVGIANIVDEFNLIGVSFESGNGDYAEWLERKHVSEYITAGDIVAIKGGKITKDLSDFEQLLVVSHKPIVLGNEPEPKEKFKGNTVAFLGQVPVKVFGPVAQGDYIVADTQFKGYGKAVAEKNMTSQDYTKTVGRAWETNVNAGPKMIKIVIGLHANSWVNEVEAIQLQQKKLEGTIETLEQKLKRISEKLNNNPQKSTEYAINK